MIKKLFNKNNYLPLFVIVNIFLIFFLPSSIIYNFNTGLKDSGIYQLISKEMLNGQILYKNIFDIKGPFIFFIYSILHLTKSIDIALFIMDLILYNTIFYLNYKTIKTNNKNNTFTYFLICLELLMIYIPFKIVNPESFILLTISYLNYWIISNKYKNPTKTQLIICGLLTGLTFWIKYSLGIYIAIIYFYFIFTHIKNKTFNHKYILYPLLGFLIPTAITLGYFIYNNALTDLFNTYFIQSFKYMNTNQLKLNYNLICLAGIIGILLINFICKRKIDITIILISYILMFITTFIFTKNNFDYYYIPFISIIPILSCINIDKIKNIFKYLNIILIIFLIILLSDRFIIININSKINNLNHMITHDLNSNYENIACLFISDTEMLTEIDNINYKYPFLPYFTYEQYPDIYKTIYKDISDKNIEYIIISKNLSNNLMYSDIMKKSKKGKEYLRKTEGKLFENYKKINYYDAKYIETNKIFKKYNHNIFNTNITSYELYKRKSIED